MKITAKAARINRDMTQQEAASKTGLSERTIWAIENGRVPFNEKHRKTLAQAYGIDPKDFALFERVTTETYATNKEA